MSYKCTFYHQMTVVYLECPKKSDYILALSFKVDFVYIVFCYTYNIVFSFSSMHSFVFLCHFVSQVFFLRSIHLFFLCTFVTVFFVLSICFHIPGLFFVGFLFLFFLWRLHGIIPLFMSTIMFISLFVSFFRQILHAVEKNCTRSCS